MALTPNKKKSAQNATNEDSLIADLRQQALEYHASEPAGKTGTKLTKPFNTQHDLALAYTPGVAEPVREIAKDADAAYQYTGKGNLVAVITDGSAVLGLGNVGALASKPVMEGKAVLFKQFAGVDVFDIEVDADTTEDFIETVVRISPTFGGINLEDIKAPQCFVIEQALIERLDIPVFHDDQHGTAIIIVAGLLNALELQGKDIKEARIVCLGAGAAGIGSMRLLLAMGASPENILMVDRHGVIHQGRSDLSSYKQAFAANTNKRTLQEAMQDTDVFIGLAGANLLSQEMLVSMAENPIVFALSNPDPEISPILAHSACKNLIMATGRSDFPNQVNNVLGFPFIFRAALDIRAKVINEAMQIAAIKALRDLAREPVPGVILDAYEIQELEFGREYILPKPLDPRLMNKVPAAVAKAAVNSGVAQLALPAKYNSDT